MSEHSTKLWVSAHLYYNEPWDRFLTEGITPFVKKCIKNNLISKFFFVRYFERGPHIRLRLKLKRFRDAKILENLINEFFNRYFKKFPSKLVKLPKNINKSDLLANNSVQFIPYVPEIERYCGYTGINISEKQFDISSRAVLKILSIKKNREYDRLLALTLQLHISTICVFGNGMTEYFTFFKILFERWFYYIPLEKRQLSPAQLIKYKNLKLKSYSKCYANERSFINQYIETILKTVGINESTPKWLRIWISEMKNIAKTLENASKKNKIVPPKRFKYKLDVNVRPQKQLVWLILESYIHMTNNRLGISFHDEEYLFYIIMKSLESLINIREQKP